MHLHFRSRPFGMPLSTPIFIASNQFILLGIHRNNRLTSPHELPDLLVEVLKLGIPILVIAPLLDAFGVGLQTVVELAQYLRQARIFLLGRLPPSTRPTNPAQTLLTALQLVDSLVKSWA